MKKFVHSSIAPAAVLLSAWAGISASSSLVDMKGRLISVEAATAITTEGTTVSVLKLRQTAKDGRPMEEIVPDTADAQADLSPQLLLDPESGDLILVWCRYDGRRMTLAAARRDSAGAWSSITYLDAGKEDPSDPQAALDTASRLHVVWKTTPVKSGPSLRHRAYDLPTLQPIGDAVDPFASGPARSPRLRAGKTKGGTAEPGGAAGQGPPGLTVEEKKEATFTTYGVETGCDAAVVFRVAGKRLEVATVAEGKWRRGDVELDAGADPAALRTLVSDIARRFCHP